MLGCCIVQMLSSKSCSEIIQNLNSLITYHDKTWLIVLDFRLSFHTKWKSLWPSWTVVAYKLNGWGGQLMAFIFRSIFTFSWLSLFCGLAASVKVSLISTRRCYMLLFSQLFFFLSLSLFWGFFSFLFFLLLYKECGSALWSIINCLEWMESAMLMWWMTFKLGYAPPSPPSLVYIL